MTETYPISKERESKLNETIFRYISSLGSYEVTQKAEDKQRFERDLRKLAKCKSFKEGIKEDGYTTVLHKAITTFKLDHLEGCCHTTGQDCTNECIQKDVLLHIIQEYPQLLHCSRDKSPSYCGQTPLHMAICQGNKVLVEMLLKAAGNDELNAAGVKKLLLQKAIPDKIKLPMKCLLDKARMEKLNSDGVEEILSQFDINEENKELVRMLVKAALKEKSDRVKELLSQNATGLRFRNNYMMGQLPLSIATLTGKEDIVELLLQQEETDVYQQNSYNDNLCHSLLKYVYIFPENEKAALKMMKFINGQKKDCCKKLFLMVNGNKETPLILAAKYGQVELVNYIIEEAYCLYDNSSGLFDVRLYDMTEIDHQLKACWKQEEDKDMAVHLKDSAVKAPPKEEGIGTASVFDLIFHHSYKTSLRFMQIRPIQWMITKKWRYYSKFLYSTLLLHIIIMVVLTAAAVERVKSQRTVTINKGFGAPFPAYYAIIMTTISPLYIWLGSFKIVQICRRKFQITFKPFLNPYANAMFQALFLLFALCIISDFAASWFSFYNNMFLIAAVVIGWYLLLFFMRANGFLCVFTSLIQRILLQDIIRFAPVITLQLVAFSTAMFMLLQNPDNPNNADYSNWWTMLLLTFKSFLGTGDIPISDSNQPVWLAIVFVIFVIMTTILMLNALIALLSSTCTDLITHFTPDMHLYLQQLAVILFLEGLLPNKVSHYFAKKVTREDKVDRYDRSRNKVRNMKRYLMRIDILEDEDGVGTATDENILHKLDKVLNEKISEKDTKLQSTLNSQSNGRLTSTRMANSVRHLDMKSVMTNSAECLNPKQHLDIYHHNQH